MKWLRRLLSSRPGPARYSDDDIVLSIDGEWRPDHEETHVTYHDGGVDVAFTAEDIAHGMQARVVVCARPPRVVTLSCFKYAPLLSPAEFHGRHEVVRAGLQVR